MIFSKNILNLPEDNELEICFFGPGYGESIVVHIPSIGWGIIDSCNVKVKSKSITPALEYLLQLLSPPYPLLSFIVLTHSHEDHYSGFDQIIKKYPGGIRRICRYDGDGIRELKIYLVQQKIANNNILPGLVQVFDAMDNAIKSGVHLRRLSEMTSIIDVNNIQIEGYGTTDIKLLALSPSAISVKKYVEMLFALYPQKGKAVKPGDDRLHNLLSVAILLKIGNIQIIFGSDVETGTDDNMGWNGILNNDCPNLWANLVKVAHHGSESGYNANAWEKHSGKGLPFAIVTPFNKGSVSLPKENDLKRLNIVTNKIGLTSVVETTEKLERYYPRDVIKSIRYRTRAIKTILPPNKLGLIRYRFLLDGTVTEEIAEPPARWL
jgi:hypothetical protein